MHGRNFIAGQTATSSGSTFRAADPRSGREIEPDFSQAGEAEVDASLRAAGDAFERLRRQVSPLDRAGFLRAIAREIESAGDALIERADRETALGLDRLRGERGRTIAQLRMFADLIDEGSWVDARIDRALPDRKPLPRPDIRRMLVPIGPVAVFGASNFPLAFSVAGGDTASALAAGCPVVVKAHPAHPGTSEIVAEAIVRAARACSMPPGIFSMLHSREPSLSLALVRHPLTAAVGFTGSLRAGRALFDAAAARPRPIPVYAEMGSVNPVFLLPAAVAERGSQIAQGMRQSITMGTGQFCTKPGVIVAMDDDSTRNFAAELASLLQSTPPAPMLYAGILESYRRGSDRFTAIGGVRNACAVNAGASSAVPALFQTDGETFLRTPELAEELFGPAAVLVRVNSEEQMLQIARRLDGHLTASIHGTPDELRRHADLLDILQRNAGRLICNGFPTGVEVCSAMQHGGPYPATTDSRTTSVGTAAIERFARPVCFQNFPADALPPELRDDNPRRIWRLVDNLRTRDAI